jgi:hypothetical protein
MTSLSLFNLGPVPSYFEPSGACVNKSVHILDKTFLCKDIISIIQKLNFMLKKCTGNISQTIKQPACDTGDKGAFTGTFRTQKEMESIVIRLATGTFEKEGENLVKILKAELQRRKETHYGLIKNRTTDNFYWRDKTEYIIKHSPIYDELVIGKGKPPTRWYSYFKFYRTISYTKFKEGIFKKGYANTAYVVGNSKKDYFTGRDEIVGNLEIRDINKTKVFLINLLRNPVYRQKNGK